MEGSAPARSPARQAKDFKLTDDVMQKIEEMPLPRCQKIEFAKFKASAMFFRHHDPCEFAYRRPSGDLARWP